MIPRIVEMRKRRGHGGFTLIELLVVIVILGILSAVVVFAVRGVDDKGAEAADKIDERTLRTAQETFCAKFGHYATEQELVDAKFLSNVSSNNDIVLSSGGTCTASASTHPNATRFSIDEAPTETVNVAASVDQWPTADNATPGYKTSAWAYPLNANVYDPLIIIGSDYTLQPGLATSWESIPVGSPLKPTRPYATTTWRFHLRQNVLFHDGSGMDADDVVWTWRDRQCLNGVGTNLNSSLTTVTQTLGCTKNSSPAAAPLTPDPVDSVEKIDQYTVDITPKSENLRLPEQIAHPKGAIVPAGKHFDGATGGLPATPHNGNGGVGTPLVPGMPIGTGPFKFAAYSPGPGGTGTAATEANESYWGTRAQVKRMDFTFIALGSTRASGVISGQYDMAIDLDPLDVTAVEAATGNPVAKAGYGQNLLIYVNKVVKYGPGDNPKYELTTDPAVRKAASLALDRDTIVNNIYQGNALPGRWMAPPGILGAHQNDVPALAYDPPQARTVLDSAGWTCGGGVPGAGTPCGANEFRVKNGGTFAGRPLDLRMIGNDISLIQAGYDLIKAQMKDVGINLTADRLTVAGRIAEYLASRFDFDLEQPNQNDANPAFLPTLRFACSRASTFRFAPADGTNGRSSSVAGNDPASGAPSTDGRYPYGAKPCATTNPPNDVAPAVLGPFDNTYVPGADLATTQNVAQQNAAAQMNILVGQNESNVVIPVAGQFRIYGLKAGVALGDPHPSQTSQRWVSLTKTSP